MQMKRLACLVLICVVFIGTMSIPVGAAESGNTVSHEFVVFRFLKSRATESFNTTIPAKTNARADSSFPLVAGETITIKASYAPFDASVDIGVVAPNGKFYYFNITNGSIDKTIQVSDGGDYTLQIVNHSDSEVKVSGFVNY